MAKIEQRFGKSVFSLIWLGCALLGAMKTAPAQTVSEIVLHNFGRPTTGGLPYAGVIRDAAGNLYGTTASGGAANAGVVYKLDATGRVCFTPSRAGPMGETPTQG